MGLSHIAAGHPKSKLRAAVAAYCRRADELGSVLGPVFPSATSAFTVSGSSSTSATPAAWLALHRRRSGLVGHVQRAQLRDHAEPGRRGQASAVLVRGVLRTIRSTPASSVRSSATANTGSVANPVSIAARVVGARTPLAAISRRCGPRGSVAGSRGRSPRQRRPRPLPSRSALSHRLAAGVRRASEHAGRAWRNAGRSGTCDELVGAFPEPAAQFTTRVGVRRARDLPQGVRGCRPGPSRLA
jgi:hypothetical protein